MRELTVDEAKACREKTRLAQQDRWEALFGRPTVGDLTKVQFWADKFDGSDWHPWPTDMPLITRLELCKAYLTAVAHETASYVGEFSPWQGDSNGAAVMLNCTEEYGSYDGFNDRIASGGYSMDWVRSVFDKHRAWLI